MQGNDRKLLSLLSDTSASSALKEEKNGESSETLRTLWILIKFCREEGEGVLVIAEVPIVIFGLWDGEEFEWAVALTSWLFPGCLFIQNSPGSNQFCGAHYPPLPLWVKVAGVSKMSPLICPIWNRSGDNISRHLSNILYLTIWESLSTFAHMGRMKTWPFYLQVHNILWYDVIWRQWVARLILNYDFTGQIVCL